MSKVNVEDFPKAPSAVEERAMAYILSRNIDFVRYATKVIEETKPSLFVKILGSNQFNELTGITICNDSYYYKLYKNKDKYDITHIKRTGVIPGSSLLINNTLPVEDMYLDISDTGERYQYKEGAILRFIFNKIIVDTVVDYYHEHLNNMLVNVQNDVDEFIDKDKEFVIKLIKDMLNLHVRGLLVTSMGAMFMVTDATTDMIINPYNMNAKNNDDYVEVKHIENGGLVAYPINIIVDGIAPFISKNGMDLYKQQEWPILFKRLLLNNTLGSTQALVAWYGVELTLLHPDVDTTIIESSYIKPQKSAKGRQKAKIIIKKYLFKNNFIETLGIDIVGLDDGPQPPYVYSKPYTRRLKNGSEVKVQGCWKRRKE